MILTFDTIGERLPEDGMDNKETATQLDEIKKRLSTIEEQLKALLKQSEKKPT